MHTLAHTCTHTLTQFSKELNSQSCIDEEQQHEEQTQIPHLDGHITRTNRYIVYDTPKNRHVQYTLKKRERETPTDRIGPKTETAEPYCTDVYYSLKTNGIHQGTWSGITPYVLGLEKQVSFWRLDPTLMSHKHACHRVLACLSSW